MKPVACSMCGAFVPPRPQCIKCGSPLPSEKTIPAQPAPAIQESVEAKASSILGAIVFVVAGGALALAAAWFLSRPGVSEHQPARNEEWIAHNQLLVKRALRDPDSAIFSEVRMASNGSKFVCGRVNSRNGFGGRTGPQRFIAAGTTAGPFLEESWPDFDAAWNKYCP